MTRFLAARAERLCSGRHREPPQGGAAIQSLAEVLDCFASAASRRLAMTQGVP